jgi:hypothetical protein
MPNEIQRVYSRYDADAQQRATKGGAQNLGTTRLQSATLLATAKIRRRPQRAGDFETQVTVHQVGANTYQSALVRCGLENYIQLPQRLRHMPRSGEARRNHERVSCFEHPALAGVRFDSHLTCSDVAELVFRVAHPPTTRRAFPNSREELVCRIAEVVACSLLRVPTEQTIRRRSRNGRFSRRRTEADDLRHWRIAHDHAR